ncbi:hypothetical protein CG719_32950 [Streptomyces sp. CB01373]|nr:hypothetical protein CG719_32950 [Streptomyces sp. CB01373]
MGCLSLWLLDPGHRKSMGLPILLGGWVVCMTLLLPATLLWHMPELLKRELGPQPKSAKGFVGYLLRNSGKGVFDGSLSLVLDRKAPPAHFWLVTGLFTFLSAQAALSGLAGLVSGSWAPPFWVAFAACVVSLGILIHGALTRSASRSRVAAEWRDGSGDAR